MTHDLKTKDKNTRADFDRPWKFGLGLYFRDFMEFCLPDIATQIDWSKNWESLDKELSKITRHAAIGNCIADKLIKVHGKNGKQSLILCHLEIEGDPQRGNLPRRMMIYRYRISDVWNLPVVSIAILIDNDPDWRTDYYREACFGTYQEVRYLVIKILDYQKRWQELEAMNNRFSMVILAQLVALKTQQDSEARLHAKTALTRQLYKKGYTKRDIIQLFTLIDWLITLPKEQEPIYNQTIKNIEEKQHMRYITTPERLGIEKGIKQGIEQGIQQGESNLLIRLLKRRFRFIPPTYLTRIQQASAETLLLWGERILDASTLEEVFL